MILDSPLRPVAPVDLPKLEEGQILDAAEFHRRYEAMPELKKAELIRGTVYMASPVNHTFHGSPHCDLAGWIFMYSVMTPGVRRGLESSLLLSGEDEPQPDLYLMLPSAIGGRSIVDSLGYIVGPVDFVAEVSSSSLKLDTGPKFAMYQDTGVQEYLVWNIRDAIVNWWHLENGTYRPLPVDSEGVIRSEVFPGLWLDTAALIGGDMIRMIQTMQQGLASPEHRAFVARLASRP